MISIVLLLAIAASEVDDVRDVLDNYRDEDDVLAAFKSRQKMLKVYCCIPSSGRYKAFYFAGGAKQSCGAAVTCFGRKG